MGIIIGIIGLIFFSFVIYLLSSYLAREKLKLTIYNLIFKNKTNYIPISSYNKYSKEKFVSVDVISSLEYSDRDKNYNTFLIYFVLSIFCFFLSEILFINLNIDDETSIALSFFISLLTLICFGLIDGFKKYHGKLLDVVTLSFLRIITMILTVGLSFSNIYSKTFSYIVAIVIFITSVYIFKYIGEIFQSPLKSSFSLLSFGAAFYSFFFIIENLVFNNKEEVFSYPNFQVFSLLFAILCLLSFLFLHKSPDIPKEAFKLLKKKTNSNLKNSLG